MEVFSTKITLRDTWSSVAFLSLLILFGCFLDNLPTSSESVHKPRKNYLDNIRPSNVKYILLFTKFFGKEDWQEDWPNTAKRKYGLQKYP